MTRHPSVARGCALAVFCFVSLAAAHEPGEDDHPQVAPDRTGPVLIERANPVYPEEARVAGIGGTVSLEIIVAEDGGVASVKVVKGAGYGLDEAALEAARHFKFKAATDHGQPVVSAVAFDQRFTVKPHITAETTADGVAPETPPPATGKYQTTVEGVGPTSAASSTTIRNLDFDLRPKTSPNDILRVVPGLLAVQHQGGGKADQLFLRGFDADHGTDVGVFLDGIPINMPSHAHGQGYADLHFLIPEAIDRIDVVKGPYDPRFGDFSTAGAINLITKKDFDESSVQLTLGAFPTQGADKLYATQRFVGIVAPKLSGWAENLHPWLAFEGTHDDGPFANPENLRRYNVFAKLSYDLSQFDTLGVFFQAYGSQWTGSGQIPQREVLAGRLSNFGSEDPSEGGLTERQMGTLFYHHKNGDGELNASLYVTRYKLALWNDFTFFLDNPQNGSEIEQDDARVFSGLKVDYHFHRRWHGISFRTTVGIEGRYDDIHVDRWDAESCSVNGTPAEQCPGGDFRKRIARRVDSSPFAFNGNNDDITQLNVAGFAEEDVVFNKYFRVVGALRADYFGFNVSDGNEALGAGMPKTSGTAQRALLSPKATVVVTPIHDLLELYLNFGMGFHTNQAQIALLDGQTLPDGKGGTFTIHAVPRIYGGELGARLHLWNRVDLAGAFWISYLENETVFDADAGAFAPSDPTRRIGVDLEARVKIFSWLYADFDLAQASATAVPDQGNGGGIALAPRLYMTGGLTAKRGGLRAGIRFRYLGDRPAFDENSPEYIYFTSPTLPGGLKNVDYDPSRVTAQGYFLVDLYGGYRWRFLEASLSIQNLFNAQWREAQFGNHSCTRDETYNPTNPNYAGSGNQFTDGSFANRCGITFADRTGVTDVHYTPGVPINLQLTVKAYF
jgi:TonB family protein